MARIQVGVMANGNCIQRVVYTTGSQVTGYGPWQVVNCGDVSRSSLPPGGKRPKFHTKVSSAKRNPSQDDLIVGSERQYQPKFMVSGGAEEPQQPDVEVINLTAADAETLTALGVTADAVSQEAKRKKVMRLIGVVVGLAILSFGLYQGYNYYYGKKQAAKG